MIDAKERERARELESARERELDSLLEHEFGGEPPIAAILHRAEHSPQLGAGSRSRARTWLAAAMALLGIGVAVALAWNARVDREDHNSTTPQDPNTPVDVSWPAGASRAFRAEQLSDVPSNATHLELSMQLHVAGDLSRLDKLQHLGIGLTARGLGKFAREGGEGKVRGRLDALATTPGLRILTINLLPLAPADMAALRHLDRLEVLELGALLPPNEDLRPQAAAGGNIVGATFDRSYGAAVASSCRAKTLRLSGMSITAEGLQALADAKLHSLILDMPHKVTPEVLLALGELTSLRHLELRYVNSVAVKDTVGGNLTRMGTRALSAAVMKRLATLPELRSLTLDVCFLDHELLQELPRQLQRLDISSCFGVDGRLAGVVAGMPNLQELGLPLTMTSMEDFITAWRPPVKGTNAHTLRLSGDEARDIIGSRAWRALRLDGRLTESVTDALADQPGLQALTLTPTSGSASLTFAAKLPKLHQLTFVQSNISAELLQPLNECASLRSVAFDECHVDKEHRQLNGILRDDIITRWGYRRVW